MKTLALLLIAICVCGLVRAEEVAINLDQVKFIYKGNSLTFHQLKDVLRHEEINALIAELGRRANPWGK